MNNISIQTTNEYCATGGGISRSSFKGQTLQESPDLGEKVRELFDGSGVQLSTKNVTFARRETVFLEDDKADCFYEITSGTMCVFMAMADGRRQIVRFASKGDIVGLTLLDRYELSVETITRSTAVRIRLTDLIEKLTMSPQLAKNLLTYVSEELIDAHQKMLIIGRKTATERVATFLWAMAQNGQRAGWREGQIRLAMSRSDIADFLGLTTETVSRAITHLRQVGIISCVGAGRVFLKDAESLKELALGFEA